jgi:hypothetical protein
MGFLVEIVELGQVFSEYSVSPANSYSSDYSTFIIYHPESVQ